MKSQNFKKTKIATEIKVNAGDVEFKNISFKYEKEIKNQTL